jgi:hypothetical protein
MRQFRGLQDHELYRRILGIEASYGQPLLDSRGSAGFAKVGRCQQFSLRLENAYSTGPLSCSALSSASKKKYSPHMTDSFKPNFLCR